jgi:hypothetical protein
VLSLAEIKLGEIMEILFVLIFIFFILSVIAINGLSFITKILENLPPVYGCSYLERPTRKDSEEEPNFYKKD